MNNSRLIKLLNVLTKKERRDIRKFIHTPFYNQKVAVCQLFDYLCDCLFTYQVVPTKQQIFKHIYPKQTYDDHRVRVMMSFLFKGIERFLVQAAFEEDEIKTKIKLAEVYRQRQLPEHFQRTIKAVRTLQETRTLRNADYYNDHFQIQLEEYQFSSTAKRTGEHNLQEISDNMDIAFLTLKLRQTCFSISHQTVYKKEYRFGLLPEIIAYIEQQNLLEIPAIAVYYHCYHALTQPENLQHYERLKTALFRYAHHFPSAEVRDLFLLTINYCIKRMNAGQKRFEQEVLEWYQEGLQHEHLMTNGILSRFTYRNITTMGLIIRDYDWVEKFIHDYKNKLEKQYAESSFNFNLARLAYEQKNYTSALQLLQQSDYKDLLLNLGAKTIALKIYYELDEFDLLDSHLDAMRNFIRRKKIIGYHRENYLNLLRMTRKLLELPTLDKEKKAQLLRQIEQTNALAEKTWLLQQLGSN